MNGKIKQVRQTGFTMLQNSVLRDNSLSAKAKGILALLLSLPDGFKVHKTALNRFFSDGRDSITTGWNELENAGFIRSTEARGEFGRFGGVEYEISDVPFEKIAEKPFTENPKTENPISENPELLNTIYTNTVKKNTVLKKKANLVFPNDEFEELWVKWVQYRKEEHRKKFNSEKTEQAAINNLAKISYGDISTAREIVETSINNGWQGLFPKKSKNDKNGKLTDAMQQLDAIQLRRKQAGIV